MYYNILYRNTGSDNLSVPLYRYPDTYPKDICPKTHLPERSNGHLSECTLARMDTSSKEHLPKWALARMDTYPNVFRVNILDPIVTKQ